MYDLTSLVPSYISRTSQRKNILAEKFSTVHFFYNTKMSIRCYLKNDVCMVSDAPSLQPIFVHITSNNLANHRSW